MAGEISIKSSNQTSGVPPTSSATVPQAIKDSLSVSSTQVLPMRVPDLKVGDSLQFLVRSINNSNGTGLLYLFGQLIEAKLPKDVNVGDRVRAEILKQDSQIILKIQEIIKKGDFSNFSKDVSGAPVIFDSLRSITDLTKKVEDLLIRLNPYLPSVLEENHNLSANVRFPELNLINKASNLSELLYKLKSILPSEETLQNPIKLAKLLKEAFSGNLSKTISEISRELGDTISKSFGSKEDRFIFLLRDKLDELLFLDKTNGKSASQQLAKLIFALSSEIENLGNDSKSTKGQNNQNYGDYLRVILTKLKTLSDQKSDTRSVIIEDLKKGIETRLENSTLLNQLNNKMTDDNINQVKSLHTVVEQMLTTQEMINRLEPIMQSLNEPEFILFPFLFQGMFGFGELVVDPDSKRNKENSKNNNSGSREEGEESRERDQTSNKDQVIHFQGQIPLPNLGVTSFEAFYSMNKIDINFSLEDDAKVSFLTKKSEQFRKDLAKIISSEVNIQSRRLEINTLSQEEIKKAGSNFNSLPILVI